MMSNLLSKDKNKNRDAPCWLPTQPSVGRVELAIKYEKDPTESDLSGEQDKDTQYNQTARCGFADTRLCFPTGFSFAIISFSDSIDSGFIETKYHCHRGWDAVHSTIDTGASTFLLRQLFTQVIIDVRTFEMEKVLDCEVCRGYLCTLYK